MYLHVFSVGGALSNISLVARLAHALHSDRCVRRVYLRLESNIAANSPRMRRRPCWTGARAGGEGGVSPVQVIYPRAPAKCV